MESNTFEDRISRIETMWTVVLEAHGGEGQALTQAQVKLLQRYNRAIYRYLLGALHNADAADELFQEFALNFVSGRFRGADPAKGRFRDYIKTSLFHLIASYHKRQKRQPLQADSAVLAGAAAPEGAGQADQEFRNSWRDELLARTWSSLQKLQEEQGGLFYTMLHYRSKHPEIDSAGMAVALGHELGRQLTAASVRQTIHRARARFAELLLDEVARTLAGDDPDALEQEVIELGLHAYCADTLQRRNAKRDKA